ncbi:FAD binding domain protein [Talaromyces stipitatus ATCC 10500]|uniref:FAD binding domain protein n=1 Tax=Talaromyces stipitatus (strain ATCC 10500 / CBS 375.48 / QM 6759 / NRRL 1006) TaxID=441959 RepID=B8LYZ6_TALSN|nr:FAD binding domain protein [Talaromyces stipitatus ATCC 10500]EED23504.1 FAD binding domain protein [Talaromyces stipitatus ATCC 10500]
MASQKFYSYVVAGSVLMISLLILRRKKAVREQQPPAPPKPHPLANTPPEQLPQYIQELLAAVSGCVILQNDVEAFQKAVDYSWAQQNREIIPACVLRPRDTHELSKIVAILKKEHERRTRAGSQVESFFSVRSGGVNPGLGASTVKDGAVVDLSLFSEIMPAPDGSTVTVGTGSKWIDVYKTLDEKGLIVMGGRNAPVGVGGLTLQGGISFYSPKYGFVCSNCVSYEAVLADGKVVTASASENPDLWRVLKGGGNNFGIVTRFTLRSFPYAPLWTSGIVTLAAFQYAKSLKAYHDYLAHTSSGKPGAFDEDAAGPILSFIYVQKLGFQILALSILYTKVPEDKKWPAHWDATGFKSLRGIRKNRVETNTSIVERFGGTAPAGTRHVQGTTTICNDLETIKNAYAIFCETTAELRHVNGLVFPFTFQAILPGWMNKGDPNIFGLENCTEPLIIISYSVTWAKAEDDEFVRSTIRRSIERIEAAAEARKAGHQYRFINYCMEWQRPYEGCGEENLKLMREASHKYDPAGLFQSGRAGGFKLDI